MAIALAITSVLLLLLFLLIVALVRTVRLKLMADRIRQNNKPEPLRKHDYIIRKKVASHGGPHPHIVYDKYTDDRGKRIFKSVVVSHEWKRRKERNPLELKRNLDPANRRKKAFVIHEIVEGEGQRYKKGGKYMNYSVHPRDRKRLEETIERWEREPKGYREDFPRDARMRRIIRFQRRKAKEKAKKGTKKGV